MATILFFGRLSEVSGTINETLPVTVKTTDDLIVWLGNADESLKSALNTEGNRIAVNKTIISTPTSISNTDEIAFMSPLSGG